MYVVTRAQSRKFEDVLCLKGIFSGESDKVKVESPPLQPMECKEVSVLNEPLTWEQLVVAQMF